MPGSRVCIESDGPSLTLFKIGDSLEKEEEENDDRNGLLVNKIRTFERIDK